ncbi:Ltp family lipoprotein [Levilactobacillus enshiensis]|uniref:Ltp family lipoprotein n=1 Tax=Levilactobacillus enshiensis TaxID=2590213 RepID=UPI001CDD86A9|nr:Ltp family lipoprotein [Levilactobacillus enshiensis]
MHNESKKMIGFKARSKKIYARHRWLISIGTAIVALIAVVTFSFKASESNASVNVDGYKLYKTTVTSTKTNESGDWIVKGTTNAPDDAKIIALTADNYDSIGSSTTNILDWAKVKNGKFTTAVSAYNAIDKPYKNGRSAQASIVAIDGYSGEKDDSLTSGLKTAILDFKKVKLTLDDALVKYCNRLSDDFKDNDDSDGNTSSESSSESTSEDDDASNDSDKETEKAQSDSTKVSREEISALSTAQEYLEFRSFSKQGLYRQLSSDAGEKFSASAAQYAVDHVEVNWNSQALKAAKSYQEDQHMSSAQILNQLTSSAGEGFTQTEAQYAVNNLPK